MLEKFIYKFVDSIAEYNNFTEIQTIQAKYSIKIISYEVIKILFLLIILYIFNYFKEGFLTILIMSSIKPFIGGYHEDTQLKCFIATLLIVILIIFLSENNTLSFVSCLILNFISIFSIYNKAPIINDKMPITRNDLIKRNRKIGLINTIFFLSLSIILFKIIWFSQIIVWTILVQTILMFNKYKILRR